MASEIHKMLKNGQTIYPATITEAVIDRDSKKPLNVLLSDSRSEVKKNFMYSVFSYKTGYVEYQTGAIKSAAGFGYSEKISLKKGDTIYAILSSNSLVSLIAVFENGIYQKDKSVPGAISKQEVYVEYTADSDCDIIISCEIAYAPNRGYYIGGTSRELLDKVNKNISDIENINKTIEASTTTIAYNSYETKGYISFDTGKLVNSELFYNSGYIQLYKGDKIYFKTIIGGAAAAFAFYDSDKSYIQEKSIKGGLDFKEGEITADTDCYVVISVEISKATEECLYTVFQYVLGATLSLKNEVSSLNESFSGELKETNIKIESLNQQIEDIESQINTGVKAESPKRDLNIILVIGQSLSIGGGGGGISNKYYNSVSLKEGMYVWNISSTEGFVSPETGPETAVRSFNQSFLESLKDDFNIEV